MRLDLSRKILAVMLVALLANAALADDSRIRVKASATAGKIEADGKQMVTVTLVIEKGWHIYANPVKNEDLASVATKIKIEAKAKLGKVDVKYPAGRFYKDKFNVECMVYEDKVDIQAVVQRMPGDTKPLEIEVYFGACDASTCLLPATVFGAVPVTATVPLK